MFLYNICTQKFTCTISKIVCFLKKINSKLFNKMKDTIKMKTIVIIFSNSEKSFSKHYDVKRYVYKTREDIKEGDVLTSQDYKNSFLHVEKVVEGDFKYFNRATGDLTNDYNSTNLFEIKELREREEESNIVYFSKIKNQEK